MSLSGISKFILGVLLAMALLALAGVGTTRYFIAQLATPPAKPTFANDPSSTPSAKPPAAPAPSAAASPAVSPTTAPLTDGYIARITQPIGLILRQDPSADAARIGGIEFNQEVTVLEDAAGGAWQRVRLSNGAEGWVKGGNTEKLN
jgi:Bacterial SH3 domain